MEQYVEGKKLPQLREVHSANLDDIAARIAEMDKGHMSTMGTRDIWASQIEDYLDRLKDSRTSADAVTSLNTSMAERLTPEEWKKVLEKALDLRRQQLN